MKYKVVMEGYIETDLVPEDFPDSTVETELEESFFDDPMQFIDAMEEDISINVEKID